jgi:ankyrin repeat protein
MLAAKEGHVAIVDFLLGKVVDTNFKDKKGQSALSWAARFGHDAVVRLFLLDKKVNIESTDNEGQTPLSWWALSGKFATTKLVLDDGAAIEARDTWGTPLW